MRLRTALALAAMAILVGSFCGLASADTVTIGNATSNNGDPFNVPAYIGDYQQVYNAALFSGPVDITAITFFAATTIPTTTISGDFTLDLSTSSAGPDTLSTTYASNLGADNTQFFSGVVSKVLTFDGTPFLYDPSQGNLLLDVDVLSKPLGSGALAAGCSTDTNRVFNLGGNGAPTIGGNPALCTGTAASFGLETEFTFTPVASPEPSSLLMMGIGLVALIGIAKFRGVVAQN